MRVEPTFASARGETSHRAAGQHAGQVESAPFGETSLALWNPLIVQPNEVAQAVPWLCSDAAGAMTGQCVSVSGGEVM